MGIYNEILFWQSYREIFSGKDEYRGTVLYVEGRTYIKENGCQIPFIEW